MYCGAQCRINAANDRRYEKNKNVFAVEKSTRNNHRVLETIWRKLGNLTIKQVGENLLKWEGFCFDSPSIITRNKKTGNPIQWYFDYGLELLDMQKMVFEIHKKSANGKP
jgi:hypothetical protein